MAMKEVYLLSVKSSCTRSGLISDISEVLSPFNVKILDVAQVLPPLPSKA
jgi:predicted amino acid-binding ACT domain protein